MKFYRVAVLLAFASTAQAQTVSTDTLCAAMGDMAEGIMENRQAGIALSLQMSHVVPNNASGPLIAAIVQGAYATPRYSVRENQVRAAQDYRNSIEAMCYQEFSE